MPRMKEPSFAGLLLKLALQDRLCLSTSPDAAPVAQPPTNPLSIASAPSKLPAKDLPEPQCLVPGTRDYRGTVRTRTQIQDSVGVASQTDDLLHAGILPHHDLILAVTVRADDLVRVLAPGQIADLGTGVDFFNHLARGSVPEFNGTISGAAAGGEEMVLMRRPGDGFDGCDVGAKSV